MEQLRGQFEQKVGTRMGRGDVRAAVLSLLAEKPMHGYQIIQRDRGAQRRRMEAEPGSVYPTLQLLADEGLVTAEESGGRKTYSLTEGRAAPRRGAEKSDPVGDAGRARQRTVRRAAEGRDRSGSGGRAGRSLGKPGAGEAGDRRARRGAP